MKTSTATHTPAAPSVKRARNAARKRWLDWLALAGAVGIGVLGSTMAYRALQNSENLHMQELRNARTQLVMDALLLDVTRAVEAVRHAGKMVEATPVLQRHLFNLYSERVITDLPAITQLQWQPLVYGHERPKIEALARSQGLSDFRVREPRGGQWVPATERPEHFPVLFAWPEANAPLGLDIGFDEVRMASRIASRVQGGPAASPVIKHVQADLQADEKWGFTIITPVYQALNANGESSPNLSGFLSGLVYVDQLLQDAALRAHDNHFDLLVFDVSGSTRTQIYGQASADHGGQAAPDTGLSQSHTLDIAGRTWQATLQPRASFYATLPQRWSSYVLVIGLALTVLLTWILAQNQKSRYRTEAAERQARKHQDDLVRERERLQNIVEGTHAGTWELDLPSGALTVNPTFLTLLGHDAESFGPITLDNLLHYAHPDDLQPLHDYYQRLREGQADSIDLESRYRHKDGSWVWLLVRGQVVAHDPIGLPSWMAGTTMDVTARRQNEEQVVMFSTLLEERVRERTAELQATLQKLQDSQEELARSEARATLSTLIASISHEMSTPMGNSLMTASTLADQARDFKRQMDDGTLRKSELTHFLSQVQDGNHLMLRNLQRAVDLLKNFRQVATDQASEQRRTFELHAALQEVLETLAPSHKHSQHRVVLEVPPGIHLNSYPGPLGQVTINLINNAYLHAFDDGMPGTITLRAQANDTQVEMVFTDNGKGIAADILDKIFVPFFSTKIGQGGSGLGMAIVENLVCKTLGGQIRVQSTPGEGTQIHITLPLTAPESQPA